MGRGVDAALVHSPPGELSTPDLEVALTTLAGHLNAATCRFLVLLGEFDAREGWAVGGVASCAHWLTWRCSLGTGTAREHVRVARALRELPRTRAAFTAGHLSFSKVRALTRLATPEREQELVELALVTPAVPLERYLRAVGATLDVEDEARRHARRHLTWRWDPDGSLVLSARLSPEDGAVVVEALEATRACVVAAQAGAVPLDELPDPELGPFQDPQGVPAGTLSGRSLADALVTICAEAGEASSDPAGPGPHQVPNPTRRPELVVHVDLSDLVDLANPANSADSAELTDSAQPACPGGPARPGDLPEPARPGDPAAFADRGDLAGLGQVGGRVDGTGAVVSERFGVRAGGSPRSGPRIEGGPGLLRETARRLACDARIVISADGPTGATLDVGRAQRFPTAALTRALWQRDGGCRYPGCAQRRYLHTHHLVHWADGGPTSAANLVLLCGTHHRAVHEGSYTAARTPVGELAFTSRRGTAIHPAPPLAGTTTGATRAHDSVVDPWTATPEWFGDRLDLSLAVEATRATWTQRERAQTTATPARTPATTTWAPTVTSATAPTAADHPFPIPRTPLPWDKAPAG